MRKAAAIVLSAEEREALTGWARSRTAAVRLAQQARIVLLAADGMTNNAISAELGIERTIVGRWRKRFAAERMAGIERDKPGRGRKATKRRHWARTIVKVTLETKPPNATQWSQRSLAEHLGIDKSMSSASGVPTRSGRIA